MVPWVAFKTVKHPAPLEIEGAEAIDMSFPLEEVPSAVGLLNLAGRRLPEGKERRKGRSRARAF